MDAFARRSLLVAGLLTVLARLTAAESWSFEPPADSFAAGAALDLRSLNEAVAGESGFVRRSADGNDFVLGNGKPIVFWGINVGENPDAPGELAQQARFLAKRGVNLVRLGINVNPEPGKDRDFAKARRSAIEHAWRAIAAMKKEGIYTFLTPYWSAGGGSPKQWGIDAPDGADSWGLLYFHPAYQEAYRAWMKELYTEKNPITGVPLAQEPAIAVIQLQNEDGLLWWSLGGILNRKGGPWQILCQQFGSWAAAKHGSIGQALAAWGGEKAEGDDAANGRLGFYQMWELTTPPGGSKGERVSDQVAFLAWRMHEFNATMAKYLRDELGCRQLINATNWRTAEPIKLEDIDRWAYLGADVTATNRYYAPAHVGPETGWNIQPGDGFTNESCTLDPRSLPTNLKQTVGQPFVVSESSWVQPTLYQSEAPLMVAGYGSLNGLDALCWVTMQGQGWDSAWMHFRPILFKWTFVQPTGFGQFPAAALIARQGYVRRGATVVHEERTLDDMAHERTPLIAEEKAFDPNRDLDKLPSRSSVRTGADPLAFLVGRVEAVLGGSADPAKSRVADLAKYIDAGAKTVTSTTGELKLHHGIGLFTIDAPKAQAAAGFLAKAGTVKLADVCITCGNAYAAIAVVPLDDAPIATSGRLLVQIGTTSRGTGWKDHEGDFTADKQTVHGRIVDAVGSDPWLVERAEGTVTVANPKLDAGTVLDPNGMPAGPALVSRSGTTISLTLPPAALYVVIEAARK
jgi:hypothetical protein